MGNVISYLTYDGKDSRDFDMYVGSTGIHGAPERDIEEVEIPGRNGTLTIDHGRFRNILVTYPCMILKDYARNIEDLKAFMQAHVGYARLEDAFMPEYYRLARFELIEDNKPTLMDRAGAFTMTFNCDPRKFLKDGEQPIALSETSQIYNPTLFTAKPLLEVTGAGDLWINNKKITITTSSTVYIDLETMNAYNGVNMNQYVSIQDGAGLKPGNNDIILDDNMTCVIYPKWWTV